MYIELQLSATAFCRIMRNNLRRADLCQAIGLEGTNPLTQVECVVDHVEILEGSSLQIERTNYSPTKTQVIWETAPGFNRSTWVVPFMQVVQPVRIHTVAPATLVANGVKPSQTDPIDVQLILDISLQPPDPQSSDRRPRLSCRFHETRPIHIPQLDQQLGSVSIEIPLNLQPLEAALNRPLNAINTGITCDEAGTFVVMRIDVDLSESGPDVTPNFYTDTAPSATSETHSSFLRSNDWALLIDRNLICSEARNQLSKALTKHPGKIKFDGNLRANWMAPVTVSASCNAIFVVAADEGVPFDLTVSLIFSRAQGMPDTLVTTYRIDVSPTSGTSLLQWAGLTLGGAVAWAFITEFLWEGVIKPAIDVTGAMSDEIKQKSCQVIDKTSYRCQQELNIVMSLYPNCWQRFAVDFVEGNTRGLVLGGAIAGLTELNALEGAVTATELGWTVIGDCHNGYRIVNQAVITMTGNAHVCSARELDDPCKEYTCLVDPGAISVTISANFLPEYMSRPDVQKYPCTMRVNTSIGVRTITFAHPQSITDEQRKYLTDFIGSMKGVCQLWQDSIHLPNLEVERPQPLEDPNWRQELFRAVVIIVVAAAVAVLPIYFNVAIENTVGKTAAKILQFTAVPLSVSGAYWFARFGGGAQPKAGRAELERS